MLALIRALSEAPCRNRPEVLSWFIRRRFAGRRAELLLRLELQGREFGIPVGDIQTLVAGLRLFSPANPWERWRPDATPRRVIDLGANLGLASLYFAVRFPQSQIVAVEMMPENVAAIRRLAELNRLDVEIANIAVGAKDGTATVQLNESHTRHRLAQLQTDDSDGMGFTGRTTTVPVSRLGRLIDDLGWSSVDLLKVDIEGAEQLLFNDIEDWADSVRTVFVEIHHNVNAARAEALMKSHSFHKIGQDAAERTELWFSK